MIRFYNGQVLKFNPDAELCSEEVWIEGSRIVYVGPSKEKPEGGFERSIDLNGGILAPGFKNAHAHTPMVFLRSLADNKPLQNWLEEDIYPNEAKLDEESAYWFTKLGIMEYVSGGITSAFDMYFHRNILSCACESAGFREVICGGVSMFDPDMEMIERDYLKYNKPGSLVRYRFGIHGEYTSTPELINYAASLAEKYKEPFFAHISETKKEVEGCYERHGKSPLQYLYDSGLFRWGGGGFHFVYVSDEDIKLIVREGLHVVSCPASNLKLASGIAPLGKMLEAGVEISLGTDGAASNNALNMFREMYLASVLQKASTGRADIMPAAALLKAACVNGALAMGLNSCTNIQEGMLADLTVIDINKPNLQPVNSPIDSVVYSGNPSNIRLTMVNGRILYEDGNYYIGESADEIYSRAATAADRIKSK